MILLADGGSTKVDWIVLDHNKKELNRIRTKGLNPNLLSESEILQRIKGEKGLKSIQKDVKEIHFYGAGCSTGKGQNLLESVLRLFFTNAEIEVKEDILAAVYAASQGNESIVCILGTGSNSCYFDGEEIHTNAPALGYIIMDEASGNYFGKRLIADYFYKKMPQLLRKDFEKKHELSPDFIREKLYKEQAPNAFLGNYATFMFDHTEHEYIHQLLEEGFSLFLKNRVLPYPKAQWVPIYFIGSIAYFFEPILRKTALDLGLEISGILRRPIDGLIAYHQN